MSTIILLKYPAFKVGSKNKCMDIRNLRKLLNSIFKSVILHRIKVSLYMKGVISRKVSDLELGCQIGIRFKKSVNCILIFEKTELTNVVSQRVTC